MDFQVVLTVIRQILIFAGGFIVAKGYIDTETLTTVVGSIVALATAAYGAWRKHKDTKTIEKLS